MCCKYYALLVLTLLLLLSHCPYSPVSPAHWAASFVNRKRIGIVIDPSAGTAPCSDRPWCPEQRPALSDRLWHVCAPSVVHASAAPNPMTHDVVCPCGCGATHMNRRRRRHSWWWWVTRTVHLGGQSGRHTAIEEKIKEKYKIFGIFKKIWVDNH